MTAMATDPTTETDLYWEARGSGPAMLLIAGTPGDGGQFEALVEELCADHLVITYDRRGTSRSPARRSGRRHRSPSKPTTRRAC